MKKIFFTLLTSLTLLGCKQPITNTRATPLPVSDNISLDRFDGSSLGFNLKLPENHAELAGVAHELAELVISENSSLIQYDCRETEEVASEQFSKIRFVLLDTSSNETHLAQYDYACGDGAIVKLNSLKTNTDYMLTVLVSNASGVTYVGNSEIFRTDDRKITVKMKRIVKDSEVEVDIVFPSTPEQKPTYVVCIFEQLDSNTAKGKSGGTCKVDILKSRLKNPAKDAAATITKQCSATKGACRIDLGVLKSTPGKIEVALDGIKVTGLRNACPADAVTKDEYLIISDKAHGRIIQIADCKSQDDTPALAKSCNVTFKNNGRKTCDIAWPEGYEKLEAEAQPSSPGSLCRWTHFEKSSQCRGIRFAKFTPSDAICECSIIFKKKD